MIRVLESAPIKSLTTLSDAPAVDIIKSSDVIGIESVENLPRRRGNPGRKKPPVYKEIMGAFDIETTNIKDGLRLENIMFVWQWYFEGEPVMIGRTWSEFKRVADMINASCADNEYFIIFVHNLSYEFQYLKSVLNFDKENVFCMDERKVLRAIYGHLEFRCSYIQTNQGLKHFTKEYKAVHYKLSEDEYDYTVKRYPWSELSDDDLSYAVNDVVGLLEAMRNRMAAGGDDLNTLPLTSTGYVRRDIKKSMQSFYKPALRAMQPNADLYYAMRAAFRGGDTHANRYYVGCIINEPMEGVDITSSYPYEELSKLYPMDQFVHDPEGWTVEELLKARHDFNFAFLIRVCITDVKLKMQDFGFPYLPVAKVFNLYGEVVDNGRILSCLYCEAWITDVDLDIILREYTFKKIIIDDCYRSKYKPLPKQYTSVIFDLFQKKSLLKGVEGKELEYSLAKAMLNSVYGLTAQDVGKLEYIYNGQEIVLDTGKGLDEILDEARKNPYSAYQWGVWCTAYARKHLHDGIWSVYDQGAVPIYVDTDSIKFVGSANMDKINRAPIRKNFSATTIDGKTTVLGTYVSDGSYKRFITFGAKKYAYEDEKGLHITIAGVSKSKGAKELAKAGGLEKLRKGFTFRKSAGLDARYNDHPMRIIRYRGHDVELTSNVVLINSTYKLSLTDEYDQLILESREMKKITNFIDNLYSYIVE